MSLDKDERGTTEETLAWCLKKAGVEKYDLDVAASADLHVCTNYYTKKDNGLVMPRYGNVWCNPPFSEIPLWVERAWETHGGGVRSISMLIPGNRSEQPFWQNMIEPFREAGNLSTHFLPKRTRFKGYKGSPNFACVLLVWR